jgi:hypothetical protein
MDVAEGTWITIPVLRSEQRGTFPAIGNEAPSTFAFIKVKAQWSLEV